MEPERVMPVGAPTLRMLTSEDDELREALARAIDEGRDEDAKKLLARFRRLVEQQCAAALKAAEEADSDG